MNQPNPKETTESSATDPDFLIVGIGASAGGLESLEQMFKSMPTDTGVAFIVMQHLSPDHKSQMDFLLRRHTDMTVKVVDVEMSVEPNVIYLNPPTKDMIISGGRLLLSEKDPARGFTLPIDAFFRSLAQDVGSRAVGVVLSGTGSDGARGVQDIHAAHGLVICQTEDTAKFDGMPRASIETGVADMVLDPEAIGDSLRRYQEQNRDAQQLAEDDALTVVLSPEQQIFQLLNNRYGVDFSGYKTTTVGRRIDRRVKLEGERSVAAYAERLREDHEELDALYKDLLIGVTRFFRDQDAFAILEESIIPKIVANARETNSEIRVWTAGCASGEEAYSLAILFAEAISKTGEDLPLKIFATDIHPDSLAAASAGVYPESTLEEMSQSRRAKFFTRGKRGFTVNRRIRQSVVFARHSIIRDAPFTRLDLITCRNLLIYFQPPAQKKALSLFHFGLKAGATLFLGTSEGPGPLSDEFEAISGEHRIYRKRRDIQLPREMRVPFDAPVLGADQKSTAKKRHTPSLKIYDQLLARHMPPSLLIDENMDLLHSFGGAEKYLEMRGGRASTKVLEMIDPRLRTPLAGALQHALRKDQPVRYSGVGMSTGLARESCTLEVEPFFDSQKNTKHLLVSFQDVASVPIDAPVESTIADAAAERIDSLESDLRMSQENLHAVIEELEAGNEELQAGNEELVASNEELQSTNEELHSVNEELYTVNAEHQRKIVELTELTNDIDNLLSSTDIGVLFLDRELCIRKFTPQIAESFHLQVQDVGRRIDHFSHNIETRDLRAQLAQVLESGEPSEFEVTQDPGKIHLLRMLPYRAAGRVDGVVLTLIDLTSIKRAEAENQRLAAIVQNSADAIILQDLEGKILSWNSGAEAIYGYSKDEALNCSIDMLIPPDQQSDYHEFIAKVLDEKQPQHGNITRLNKQRRELQVSLGMTPQYNAQGELMGVSTIERDVTKLAKAQHDLRLMGRAISAAVNGIIIVDALADDMPVIFSNQSFERITGYPADEVVGRNCRFLQGPDTDQAQLEVLRKAITEKESARVTLRNYRKNGEPFWNDLTINPVTDEQGQVTHFVGIQHDITPLMESLQNLDQARTDAETANMAKSAFLANMSHEIRTPMTTIIGLADLLISNETDADQLNTLQLIRKSGGYLSELVNDILDLSKIEAGKLHIERMPCSPTNLLLDVCELLQVRAEESGLSFDVQFEEHLPKMILSDPMRLRQILINLIGNAIKFTSAGGVTVFARLATNGESLLEFAVQDTGVGMSAFDASRVFQPFTQVDESTTRRFGGTGLGLAISKRLAGALGGDIAVDSKVGQGSTFIVRIPVESGGVRVDPEQCMIDRRNEVTEPVAEVDLDAHILLAEDTRGIQFLITRMLEQWNAKVTVANDGLEALERFAEATDTDSPFDVILMDMHMPKMDGYQAVAELRSQGCETPIIAITANAMRGDQERCLEIGCDDFITKPVDQRRLVDVLTRRIQNPK